MEKKRKVKVLSKFKMCEIPSELSKDAHFSMAYSHSQKSCKSHDNSAKQNQVSAVMLFGVPIVSLVMDGKERLCLAQISSTLLKEFSYNEIHNRRVALGITCIQCTPVQLEILRRAGAMPVTSRRCGMITRREAERLCQSFLGDHAPPQLPENFSFDVYHECAWGCRGNFVPSRYNSSRAKCIRCSFCQLFFSPNKFIFHSHRLPESRYVQPDAANFNSWRRHLRLCGDPPEDVSSLSPLQHQSLTVGQGPSHSTPHAFLPKDTNNPPTCPPSDHVMATAQIVHAWEDVKAMFNGGTRKRLLAAHSVPTSHSSVKRSSPSKMSPSGSYTTVNRNTSPETVTPSTRQTPLQQLHVVNSQQIISGGSDGCGSVTSGYISPLPGNSSSFLSPGRIDGIWNPGVANISERGCPINGNPMQSLPLGIHPLSIPWFRRPLFPFSHPFGPSCKYLADGTLVAESLQPPGSNHQRFPSSAFKPVGQHSNTAEHLFTTWLNGSGLSGNLIQIPEDLSLGSGNSSNMTSTSPIFLQANVAGIQESVKAAAARIINAKFEAKNVNSRPLLHQSQNKQYGVYNSHSSIESPGNRKEETEESSVSSDDETVDVESTDSDKAKHEISPSNDKPNDAAQRNISKRSVEMMIENDGDDEVDVDSEDVDIADDVESCRSTTQQRVTQLYSNSSHSNRGHTSKRKKRLWDFDTRSRRIERAHE